MLVIPISIVHMLAYVCFWPTPLYVMTGVAGPVEITVAKRLFILSESTGFNYVLNF